MIVNKDGSGDYTSITQAIASIKSNNEKPITIFIKPGIYKEKLYIEKPNITLIGEDARTTIITYDDYALKTFENGEKYGTFRSYTTFIGAPNFIAKNLTFENSSGLGSIVEQAVAVYVDADKVAFLNCRLLGHQDTLFTGPLPPSPIQPGSFKGPRENAPRICGRQYYKNCYIEGDIDFIFGSSTAYFEDCEIFSHNLNKPINGYITAPSTPEDREYGYVFYNCHLTSNAPAHTVYLGRPWRNFAKAAFINCELGAHITKEGWHDWNKLESHTTSVFAEANCTGEGSSLDSRASWSHQLTQSEADFYSIDKVLSGEDHWEPWIHLSRNL